ncbi:MAG: hypothetical protein HOY69_42085 [Streptomyces sp.]|nr:hypothetical protein [Streptomyces sp.]
MRHHATAALSAVLLAAAATACSGGSSGSSASHDATSSTPAPKSVEQAASSTATVTTKDVSPLGKILVNDKNLSLYLFLADKSTTSTCNGACAAVWPPLTVSGKPTGSGGVQAGKLGTSKRSDGSMQVTYNGHPLYRFAPDTSPGNVRGQGLNNFGAKWYVVGTDGKQITTSPKSTPSGY